MFKPGGGAFIILLGLIFACGSLGTDLFAPAQPAIVRSLSGSVFQGQLILSAFFIGVAVAQLLFGPLSDRFGRKPILRAGLWLFALSSLACAMAPSIEVLIGLRLVQGFSAAAGTVVARAVARDHFHGRDLGRAMAYLSLTLSVCSIVLPPIGAFWTTTFGWQANFMFLTVLTVLIALLMQASLRESVPVLNRDGLKPEVVAANIGEIVSNPTFLGFTVIGGLCFAGLFSFISNSSFVFIDALGVSAQKFGFYLGTASAGYALGTFSGGRAVMRYGSRTLIAVGASLCCTSGLAMGIASWLAPASPFALLVPMVVYMMGAGLVFPQCLAGALEPFPAIAGTASAIMGAGVMLLSSATSAGVAALYAGSPTPMIAAVAVMGTVTLISYLANTRLRFGERRRPGEASS